MPPPTDDDIRVRAALAVLGGEDVTAVAHGLDLDARLVRRWVEQFVRGGTAAVRNEPLGDEVHARDRLLAAINHELRTPLTKVQGYVGLLDRDLDKATAAGMRDEIRTQFAQLNGLLRRLDETTAASLGRLDLDVGTVLLSDLLSPLEVPVTIRADGPIVVDAGRVRTIVGDLVALARRGPATEDVRIIGAVTQRQVDIVVERQGEPFDPTRLAAELDPFAPREDHSDITFGLHLAMALTVLHGGQLGVRRVDDRDELWVRLPVRRTDGDRTVIQLRH